MHIFLLMSLVVSGICGYFLSLPLLMILSFLAWRALDGKPDQNSGISLFADVFTKAFNFFILINMAMMWLVAIVVRWESLFQILKQYVFR